MVCGTDPVRRKTEDKPLLVWHILNGMTKDSGQTAPGDDTPASALSGSVVPGVPHGWDSGRKACCVSHDQTLLATGTWGARQIEGIQVKVEARRHLPSQLFRRMTQIL